jgi:nuclear protein localization family protein 4
MIPRERDRKMCRHGDKGMCDYCMPLEVSVISLPFRPSRSSYRANLASSSPFPSSLQPYDATYHADQKIKHLSFPSYLRKLTGSISASKAATSSSAVPPLSPPDFRVASPCPSGSHAPWPHSICSKCQPSAITLQSQEYRLVDHVEFADPSIIDRFLEGWRRGGKQRFGFLIGRYMPYETVPMGVKAVVEAVEEPEQEGEIDGVSVDMPWRDEERVKRLARWCANGLQVVGMVYTDLTP